jgi:DNA repair photolyase
MNPMKPSARGANHNPKNRFETIEVEPDSEFLEFQGEEPRVRTQYLRDSSRSLITYNTSPDVGFDAGINAYRGCEHGCAYCYARPMHEYLGFSAGLDFESKIIVKENAPELLRAELAAKKWKPQPLSVSGASDPYQPVERRLEITRRCLEVLVEYRNPLIIVTKNHLVSRDIDLLLQLAEYQAVAVCLSITTLDVSLSRKLEPRTSTPNGRLKAIHDLSSAGIPAGLFVAPVIPGLTDHEIPGVMKAAALAGASFATYIMLRLPYGVKDLFRQWLDTHFPDRREKVLNRVASIRNGRLNETRFTDRMRGHGTFARQVADMFQLTARKHGLATRAPDLSVRHFKTHSQQPSLL